MSLVCISAENDEIRGETAVKHKLALARRDFFIKTDNFSKTANQFPLGMTQLISQGGFLQFPSPLNNSD